MLGIPTLQNVIAFPAHVSTTVKAISSLFDEPPVWGIYITDQPALVSDGATTVDVHFDSSIANAPQEGGRLLSYNKVKQPYKAHITLLKGGDINERDAFIGALLQYRDNLQLLSVVTPDHVYNNCNITSVAFTRNPDRGYLLISAEIGLDEVMIANAITEKPTADSNGTKQQNNGQVEAKKA
jgi:hypothetical protein